MRNVFVGACLCVAASGVAALSLGASRGAVVLGSAIDLGFEVRPDPGKDLASSCISARLVSGATSIADSRVRVTPIEGGASPMVRVQASMVADEPVLTVTLTAGCEGRVTRTYTFLADPPAAGAANPQGPLDIGRLGTAASGTSAARGTPARPTDAVADAVGPRASDAGGATAQAFVRREKPQAGTSTGQAAAKPARPRMRATVPAPVPTAAARLIVEPLDLWLDAPLELRLSREEPLLLSTPDEARRAEFAALWKVLNSSPADLRQSMERLGRLEADAAAHRRQADAGRAEASGLRQQLTQLQSQSFSAGVVYALGGALVLALAAIAWLLLRTRREVLQAWHNSVALSEGLQDGAVVSEGPDGRVQFQVEPEAADTWHPSSASPEDMQEVGPEPSGGPDTIPLTSSQTAAPAPMAPIARPDAPAAAPRPQTAQPEGLFDIQQQAEFFISIGEHEQAIRVLRGHIDEQGDAMPAVYLELLRLFQMLGRTDSFDQLRGQFQERFNVQVPRFTQWHESGHALEDYPEALAQIEALWSSPEVLGVLDGFLFRSGDGRDVQRFDLAAFDDLLLLLAIAQTTPAHLRGAPPPRARTTPRSVAAAQARTFAASGSLDSIAGDLSLMPSGYDVLAKQPPVEDMLDVDLSKPAQFTLRDHPPEAGATAPAHGQSVGFAMDDDKMELRFELERVENRRY
ncbi:type IV pilus assembly protein FimV [Alicycliphilus sp. T452]